MDGVPFLNLFSVNDPQSTRQILERYTRETNRVTFVYNHRADRPDRLLLFIRHFFTQIPCRRIVVIGENRALARRLLRKSGLSNVETAADCGGIFQDRDAALIVGVGNIKGAVYDMIHDLEVDSRE